MNAQDQATQISQDGVYVVGTDIPGGTWHTSGGSRCYEATLNSTSTSDIIDNNNFTGLVTVNLSGEGVRHQRRLYLDIPRIYARLLTQGGWRLAASLTMNTWPR
ncbi:MAG: hypothetical protein JO037_13315 [Actinobacteria bacterium]|nr:hypothetical protein [Actinomycetota bacterium]